MLSRLTTQTVQDMATAGTRLDARKLLEFRKPKITTDFAKNAEGSALVELGNTKVIVGLKMSAGEPYPDAPKDGVLTTTCELTPIASSEFETGPPSPEAVELARVVDRVIRESKMIEFDKLLIEEGKVWMCYLDFYTLDMDGNLFDAAVMGAVAAIRTAKMPKFKDGQVVYERKDPLPLKDKPASVTFAKIGNSIIVDPTETEESVLSARLTVGVDQDDNVCALQKGGIGGFTKEEVEFMLEEAIKQTKSIRKLLP